MIKMVSCRDDLTWEFFSQGKIQGISCMLAGIFIILTTVFFFLYFDTKNFYINPFSFCFLGFVLYCFFIPINMELFGDYDIPFLLNNLNVSYAEHIELLALGLSGFISCAIGYGVAARWFFWAGIDGAVGPDASLPGDDLQAEGRVLGWMTFLLFAFFISTQSGNILTSMQGYAENVFINYSESFYGFEKSFSFLALSTFINFKIIYSKKPLTFLIMGLIIFFLAGISLFNKSYFLYGVFAVFCYLHRIGFKNFIFTIIFVTIGIVLVMYILMPLYSIYRGTGTFDLSLALTGNKRLYYSDPLGPFAVLIYLLKTNSVSEIPDLFTSLFLWIPRFIWTTRPMDISEAFAHGVMPDWAPGFGVGFSPIAEGVVRFGPFGAFLQLGINGFTIAALTGAFLTWYPRSLRIPLLMSVGANILFYINRGTFSGIFTSMLQFYIPHVVLFLLCRFFIVGRISFDRQTNDFHVT